MFNITLDEAKSRYNSLTFNGTKLVPDLYGRAQFSYVVEVLADNSLRLSGLLRINKREYDLSQVDCLFAGPPPGFIKGMFLYFIGTDVRFKEMRALPRIVDRDELERLQNEEVELIVLGALPTIRPVLKLQDPFGVTAELSNPKHEADLALTHYQKRHRGWVCPSDKVFESLSLLYAGGWQILSKHGQEVVPFEKLDVDWESDQGTFHITGSAHFYGSSIDIKHLSKQRQVTLEGNKIGLLPENFKLFQWDTLRLKKEELGKLTDLMGENVLYTQKGALCPLQSIQPITTFLGHLRPYQQAGLNWLWFLYQNGFSGLLADDMGLGKTVQTLAFLSLIPGPILIVLPTTLKFNWLAEIERFLPTRNHDITLVSYAYLRQNISEFQQISWEAVILDEAQAIKNRATDSFKAITTLKSRFRLSITGTPIENHLSELVTHFKFLLPRLELTEEPFSLKKLTAPFLLRRKKEQVLPDLPAKIEETVLIDLPSSQKECYERYLSAAKTGDLASKSRLEILEVILRCRQIACHPLLAGFEGVPSGKIEALFADLEVLCEEKRKVIVFSQFTSLLKLLGRELNEKGLSYLYLDGETKDREAVITTFQNEKEPLLFLMSLKAGGVGLNLTKADTILLLDPWWNTAVEDQAIARAHRIGREGTVFAKRYVARGTVEEKMEILKMAKKNLADQMISEEKWSEQDLLSLLDYSSS